MSQNDFLLINHSYIENRIRELDLKQYWIAEQLGVSPRTVMRWLSGDVKKVRRSSLDQLAQILETASVNLIVDDESESFTSRDHQIEAARLVEEENLLKIFKDVHHWSLFENLVRSVMTPHLPKHRLGILYTLLAYAKVRNSQPSEAIKLGEKAFHIGQELNDSIVMTRAAGELAVAYSYAGDFKQAQGYFNTFKELKRYLDPDFAMHMAINYATMLSALGEHEEALLMLSQGIRHFKAKEKDERLATAYLLRGVVFTFLERWEEASSDLEEALKLAHQNHRLKTAAHAQCYLVQVESHRGNIKKAESIWTITSESLDKIGLPPSSYLHSICQAKIAYAKGNIQEGYKLMEKAILDVMQSSNPLQEAYTYEEIYRLSRDHGEPEIQALYRDKANKIFRKIGALKRLLPEG